MSESLISEKIIGYDLDDVLVATGETVIGWYNIDKGTELNVNDWYHPSPDLKRWNVDDFSEAVLVVNGYFSERPDEILPIPGAVEFVARRNEEGYEQHIVTGRPNIALQATLGALTTHFGSDRFASVSFTDHYNDARHQGVRQTKADICKAKGIELFTEDLPVHATALAVSGIRTVMFGNYPWNKGAEISEGMLRAFGWGDVEALVQGSQA